MKKALCVGINNYPGFTNDLKGCVNDANDWGVILEYAGFQVDKLLDSQATKQDILKKLETLLTSAGSDDQVVFTYSGHGTSVADRSGDEIDGYDEALVAYDGTILDDELRAVLQKVNPQAHIVIIADSCFSGTDHHRSLLIRLYRKRKGKHPGIIQRRLVLYPAGLSQY